MTRPDAVVVGAGFSGVAAATALAERGARVLVLETRQRPGGRAYSWTDPLTGEVRDNGQHVLAAFYDETWKLLRRIGTEGELEADPTFRLRFWERGRGEYELRCPRLPSPLHWIAAIARCPRLGPGARLAAASLRTKAEALMRNGDAERGGDRERRAAGITVARWLERDVGEPDLATILQPLALAALNESPLDGSALLFARVLDRLLEAPAGASGLALARHGLGDLLGGYERYLEARGGSARYRATALGVRVESGRAGGVSLHGGERIDAGCVILSVPHERVTWLLRAELAEPWRGVAAVPWSPIVSTVHVYDRPVLPARFIGLIGTPTQWAFDRGAAAGGFAVGTVRSAAFADAGRTPEAIADETAADLGEAFPAAREARLVRSRVYKERRATMRATPESDALRPPTRTHIEGLYLAGDWTDTGFPPTIESAVLSGHRAAEAAR